MTDERVDELLADLDRALAIEPAPGMAARVRTQMESASSNVLGRRWVFAVAATAVIVLAGYLAWPRPAPERPAPPMIASTSPVQSVPPAVAPVPDRPGAAAALPIREGTARPPQIRTTAASRELEVLVSPSQRIALEQLAAALGDVRLTEKSLAAAREPGPQEPLIVPILTIEPFKADVIPPIGGGEGGGTSGGVIRRLTRFVAAY